MSKQPPQTVDNTWQKTVLVLLLFSQFVMYRRRDFWFYFGFVVVVDTDPTEKVNAEKTGSRTHGHRSWLRGEKESSQTDTPFLALALQARITEAPVGWELSPHLRYAGLDQGAVRAVGLVAGGRHIVRPTESSHSTVVHVPCRPHA